MRAFGLSKGASHFRKVAAELIQRFPEVGEHLRSGQLCITSVVELARVLTPENRGEVLPRFFHASKQEAKAVAAEILPAAVVPQRVVVTSLAPRAVEPPAEPARLALRQVGAEVRPVELERATPPAAPAASTAIPTPRAVAEPLSRELRRMHVTVSARFLEKLKVATDALSHSHPGAGPEAILEAGLDLLIERAAKRKGISTRPRAERAAPKIEAGPSSEDALPSGRPPSPRARSRYIPAAVKREVWIRDGGRCRWPTAGGGICGSTHRLELDHVVPVARGGASTVEGLRLLCDLHNAMAAREAFGDAWMDAFTRKARGAEVPASTG